MFWKVALVGSVQRMVFRVFLEEAMVSLACVRREEGMCVNAVGSWDGMRKVVAMVGVVW